MRKTQWRIQFWRWWLTLKEMSEGRLPTYILINIDCLCYLLRRASKKWVGRHHVKNMLKYQQSKSYYSRSLYLSTRIHLRKGQRYHYFRLPSFHSRGHFRGNRSWFKIKWSKSYQCHPQGIKRFHWLTLQIIWKPQQSRVSPQTSRWHGQESAVFCSRPSNLGWIRKIQLFICWFNYEWSVQFTSPLHQGH